MISNRDLKKKVISVLFDNYGFAPTMLKDIILLEADNEKGQYIKFQIGRFIYSWDSHTLVQLNEEINDLADTNEDKVLESYKHVETGEIVYVLDINDKYKTIMVETSDHKTVSMALPTFRRCYISNS